MSLTGDPDGPPYRAGISVFDVMAGLHATIGILAALHAPRRAAAGASTSRSTCCPSALSGLVNHVERLRRRRRRARSGWATAHPSLFPYEPLPTADGDLIVTAGNDGQFRKLCRGARRPRARRRPAVRAQPGPHRQPRGAAAAAGRAARAPAPRWSGSATCSPPACRAGRSTRSTTASPSPSSSASTRSCTVGEGDAAVPSVRNPITLLRRRRRATCCRRPGSTSTAPSSALARRAGRTRPTTAARRVTTVPDLARHLDRDDDPPARPGPGRGPDGQGRLRRARVLAGRRAPPDARARCASSRPCWSRWPTTGSPRPRSPPG